MLPQAILLPDGFHRLPVRRFASILTCLSTISRLMRSAAQREIKKATVAELADALASGASGGNPVKVRLLSVAFLFSEPHQLNYFMLASAHSKRCLQGAGG